MNRIERNLRLAVALSKVHGAKFASFLYRTKTGKLARYTMILGASMVELYKKDIEKLETLIGGFETVLPTLTNEGERDGMKLLIQAAMELHSSRVVSLKEWEDGKSNPAYTRADYVEPVPSIPNLMWVTDKKTGDKSLAIKSLWHNIEVIEPGEPKKPVNSAPLTLAKQIIQDALPSRRIMELKLDNIGDARMNGEVLELIPDDQ